MMQTANLRTVRRHLGLNGSVRFVKATLPWNAGALWLVLRKPFRCHRLRVVYSGPSHRNASAIYAQAKSEADREERQP